MGSSSASRGFRTPAVILLLFLAHAREGTAQPIAALDSPPSRQSFAELRAQVERAAQQAEVVQAQEIENGPLAPELIDELVSLASIYHEIGNHGLAVESLERALQVQRVNYGLSSFDQVPMLRQLIAVHQSRGDWLAVRDLQDRIIRLARAH